MKDLWKLYRVFFSIGICTFGGGYAMLSLLQRVIVEKYHWASEEELMDYYAIGQCTPGIIALNTSTFIGYKYKKLPGAIVATLGFLSPSLVIIVLIAAFLQITPRFPWSSMRLSGFVSASVHSFLTPCSSWAKNPSPTKSALPSSSSSAHSPSSPTYPLSRWSLRPVSQAMSFTM